MSPKAFAAVLVLGCGCIIVCQSTAAAAGRKTAGATDAAAPAVESVLRAEAEGRIDRRERLADALQLAPDSPRARWQAGYVRNGDWWQIGRAHV